MTLTYKIPAAEGFLLYPGQWVEIREAYLLHAGLRHGAGEHLAGAFQKRTIYPRGPRRGFLAPVASS